MPAQGIPREELVLDPEGGVQWALIYVSSGLEGRKFETPQTAVAMETSGFAYRPHVAGLQVGQELLIENRDSVLHFPHAIQTVNPQFGRAFPVRENPQRLVFSKPEIMVGLRCDVHPWMSAWVGVLDHPFFAVTDAAGRFEIRGIPPGKFRLSLWHEKLEAVDLEIELSQDRAADFVCTRK